MPNAIAARCLADSCTEIFLFHSSESLDIARNLQNWISKNKFKEPRLIALDRPGDEYRSNAICDALKRCFKEIKSELKSNSRVNPFRFHLNYTGGTKAMTVHSYRVLEKLIDEDPEILFEASYLNPDDLCLITNEKDRIRLESTRHIEIDLKDFLDLHGWKQRNEATERPILPELASTLLEDLAQHGPDLWDRWVSRVLMPHVRKPKEYVLPGRLIEQDDPVDMNTWHQIMLPNGKHLQENRLREVRLDWSELREFKGFLGVLNQVATLDIPFPEMAKRLGLDSKLFSGWLEGKWLESAVMQALLGIRQKSDLHQVLMNIELSYPTNIEFDIIAVKGYRLFAFSCTTGKQSKGQLKSKLFEAYTRARQMGGDEARTALVCCHDRPYELQSELESEFDLKRKIRVFGRTDLANLPEAFADWIS